MLRGGGAPKYEHNYLFEFCSSGTVPKYSRLGVRRVLKLPVALHGFINPLLSVLTTVFQVGAGREEEVIEKVASEMPYHMIMGGSTSDDNRWETSYQFFNNTTLTNSFVALSVNTIIGCSVASQTGFKPTGITMKPTKIGNFGCSIVELDNQPALYQFTSKIGWPQELFDERLHRRTLYYPLGLKDENGEYLRLIGLVIGSNLVFSNRVRPAELGVYTASGASLIGAVDTAISEIKTKGLDPGFLFVVSCTTRLEALGAYIYAEQEKLKKAFGDAPFLILFASGEDSVGASGRWVRRNESFNVFSFYEKRDPSELRSS